ncbi:MAG: dicarboxylate/amino acid:cation symporter [Acidobacteria bacterium]|nr:dicarboxylate/amino acid:cation symporter [Acidobacteriota bacterium]MCB9377259.1 dicarboxylate/amino acid:cation symporter [Holophagales bacterium]
MKLHTKILLGLALGGTAGIAANLAAPGAPWIDAVNRYVTGPAGQIFLRLLFMVVIPLVFSTLSLGVAGLGDLRNLGRVGAKTLAFFLLSTALAAALGLTLVNLVRPGEGLPADTVSRLQDLYSGQAQQRFASSGAGEFGIDTFVNIVPRNPVRAAADMQMLSLIFFSIVFGVALALIPAERAAPMVRVLESLAEAVTKIIELAMRLAPYGVFALIFVVTSTFGWSLLRQLALYVVVVLLGLALHATVTLSALVRGLAGLRPTRFWSKIREVAITAFSTSSSNATLPTTLLVAERNLRIPPKIGGFVLPLGATMNMNGTALFEGVTVLFVAQVFGIELTLAKQAIIVVLSVLTAIGTAGVPGGSIPLLMMMATSVGVPGEGIAIILGVDRILDMSRTVPNVAGDLTAACFVARSEGLWDPRDAEADADAEAFPQLPLDDSPTTEYEPPAL